MKHEGIQENEYILRKYEYKVPLWSIGLLMPFSLLITFMGVHEGIYNTQALIITRRFSTLVELSPEQAKIFYWLMALFGLALLTWSGLIAVSRFQTQRNIIITTDSIILPQSLLSSKTIKIPFYVITDLQVMSLNGQRFANIFVNSRKYKITASCLPKPQNLDEILLVIVEAIRQNQGIDSL